MNINKVIYKCTPSLAHTEVNTSLTSNIRMYFDKKNSFHVPAIENSKSSALVGAGASGAFLFSRLLGEAYLLPTLESLLLDLLSLLTAGNTGFVLRGAEGPRP
jgi:hypothetical protein